MLIEKSSAKYVPQINSKLRHQILRVPKVARNASGIVINGQRIKSLVFTTDIAIIPQLRCRRGAGRVPLHAAAHDILIHTALLLHARILRRGRRHHPGHTARCSWPGTPRRRAPWRGRQRSHSNEDVQRIANYIDIPLVVTVVSEKTDIAARLEAGASILNVSAAMRTPEVVKAIRRDFPDVPIIATGGGTEESIMRTVEAGGQRDQLYSAHDEGAVLHHDE